MARRDLLFMVDVETDGPIPGPYSMLSIGAVIAGIDTGTEFYPWDPDSYPGDSSFYAELKPLNGASFIQEALEVSGLDRDVLFETGQPPTAAINEFAVWVTRAATIATASPVFTAWPAAFDWTFVYWYLSMFNSNSPFGFSRVLCLKQYSAFLAKTNISSIGKRLIQKQTGTVVTTPHTHNALDDAKGQAELLTGIMKWRDLNFR